MITTLPGTTLLHLTANGGENHTNGWVFSITGDGPYDHLFTIVGDELKVGNDYVSPGTLSVNVEATHATYGTYSATIPLDIVDFGWIPNRISRMYTPADHFPVSPWTTYEIIFSFRYDASMPGTDNVTELIGFDSVSQVTLYANGSIDFVPQTGDPVLVYPPGTISFDANEWNTFRMVRENRGSGYKTYYEFNGVVILPLPNDPLLNMTKFTPCFPISGSNEVELSNVRVKIDDVVYVQEEFKTGIGVFIYDPSYEYNDQVSYDMGLPQSFEYNDSVTYDLGIPQTFEYNDLVNYDITPVSGADYNNCVPPLELAYTITTHDPWTEFFNPAMEGTFVLDYQGVRSVGGAGVWSKYLYSEFGDDWYWQLVSDGTGWYIRLDTDPLEELSPWGFFAQPYENGICTGPCNPWANINLGAAWVELTPTPNCSTTNPCGGCNPELLNDYTVTISGLTDFPDGNGVWLVREGADLPFVGNGVACQWVCQTYIPGPFGGTGNWVMSYNGIQGRWELGSESVLGFYKSGPQCDGPTGVWVDAAVLEFSNNPASCVVS